MSTIHDLGYKRYVGTRQRVAEPGGVGLDHDVELGVAAARAAQLVDRAGEPHRAAVHDHGLVADPLDVGQQVRRQHDRA
ncbi:MAG TPA: hypothetical protein VFD36_23705, partial [Kofleriaceae bacterium]|nr:hypothetical protein [Kofleriaceae bacterium]